MTTKFYDEMLRDSHDLDAAKDLVRARGLVWLARETREGDASGWLERVATINSVGIWKICRTGEFAFSDEREG